MTIKIFLSKCRYDLEKKKISDDLPIYVAIFRFIVIMFPYARRYLNLLCKNLNSLIGSFMGKEKLSIQPKVVYDLIQ